MNIASQNVNIMKKFMITFAIISSYFLNINLDELQVFYVRFKNCKMTSVRFYWNTVDIDSCTLPLPNFHIVFRGIEDIYSQFLK